MSDTDPWTIERIRDALGNDVLGKRFLGEIYRAPLHEVPDIFAKWQGRAERTLHTAERIRQAHAEQLAGRDVPGEWIDASDRLQQHRGAA
jgi:hypothetical protein